MTDNTGSQMGKSRRIMREFRIDEISAVDRPAQEGARAVLMKRNDSAPENGSGDEAFEKGAALTSAVDGHTHLLMLNGPLGDRNAGETNYSDGHSHPWVRTPDGRIIIGEANGHSHTVSEVGKSAGDEGGTDAMSDKNPNANAEAFAAMEKRAKEAEAKLAKAETLGSMDSEQRSYYDGLPENERDAFLTKSDADRSALVKAANAADPVVYKSAAGDEFRASDDPRMVAMAKRADEAEAKMAKANEAIAKADFEKRAGELQHIPGDLDTRVEMLKAIDAIPDESARKRSLEALKAQNEQLGKSFRSIGHSAAVSDASADADGPQAQLNKMVDERIQKGADGLTKEQAMAEVLMTSEGAALYKQMNDEQAANATRH